MAAAEAHCAAAKVRLTDVRRRTLSVLLDAHRAMGAYEILELLRQEGFSAQPPVAYRALEFWQTQGFVHRIEKLNAFIACSCPGAPHDPAFLICRACQRIAEEPTPTAESSLGQLAQRAGFVIERANVEALGLCPDCQIAEHRR